MGKHRLFVAALLLGTLCCGAIALASVDLSAGIRYVSPSGTLADCSAKAKAAIEAYLPGATEAEAGSGEWMATAQNPATGAPSAAAAVRCYPFAQRLRRNVPLLGAAAAEPVRSQCSLSRRRAQI